MNHPDIHLMLIEQRLNEVGMRAEAELIVANHRKIRSFTPFRAIRVLRQRYLMFFM